MDEGAIQRARERLAAVTGGRADSAAVEAALERARRALSPIRDLRPDLYGVSAPLPA